MPEKNALESLLTNSLLLFIFALAAAFAGQYYLYTLKQLVPGLVFFAAASAVFIYSLKNTKAAPVAISLKTEKILFSLILIIAAFFRFYKINEIPAGCFADEAQNVFDAMKIMKGELPVYIGFSTHNAALFLYPLAALFNIIGADAVQLRAVTALFGFLTVPALYFLLRAMAGPRTAVIGGFILAFMRWHVNFNRIGYHASFALFIFVLLMYFTWKCYTDRKWPHFLLFGLTLGLSQHTYQSARLIPIWLAVIGLVTFVNNRRFFTESLNKLIVAAMLSLIVASPVINYALKNPGIFFQRQNEVNIFSKSALEGTRLFHNIQGNAPVMLVMAENIKDTLLMFNYSGDINPKHNIPKKPVLDFITGIFMFLGLLLSLYKIRSPQHVFFLSLFAVFIVPGFITIEAPQSLRLFFLVPAVVFFAASAFELILAAAENRMRIPAKNPLKIAAAAAALALLLTAGINNFLLYFKEQAQNLYCWHEFSTDAWTAGMFFREKGPSWLPVLSIEKYKIRTFNLAAFRENTDRFNRFSIDESVPVKGHANRNFAYMLAPHYLPLLDSLLKKVYPKGEFVPFYNKYSPSWMTYFAFVVFDWQLREGADTGFEKNGLKLKVWFNSNFEGRPSMDKTSPVVFLDPDFGDLSYEWTGKIKTTLTGRHTFTIKSKGRSELYIDGKKLVENPGDNNYPAVAQNSIELKPGLHAIKARYSQSGIFAAMELRWSTPAGYDGLVPIDALYY